MSPMHHQVTVTEAVVLSDNLSIDLHLPVGDSVHPVLLGMSAKLSAEHLHDLSTNPPTLGMGAEVLEVGLDVADTLAVLQLHIVHVTIVALHAFLTTTTTQRWC